MRPFGRALSILLAGLLPAVASVTVSVFAWTPAMDERVAREAARLMPRSLRAILEAHAAEVRAGLDEAAREEGAPIHHLEPGAKGAGAAAGLEAMAAKIVTMIDSHTPFPEVARAMGELSHLIGDLNNPLQVSSEDPREGRYARDYAEYVQSNLDRYPLVFYGWTDRHLDLPGLPGKGNVKSFAAETARRARRYYGHIRTAYAQDNSEPLARRFDVRSLPFGIGSLSYSHSVTDTARIWLHIWNRAHGDIRGTPYLTRDRLAAKAGRGSGAGKPTPAARKQAAPAREAAPPASKDKPTDGAAPAPPPGGNR